MIRVSEIVMRLRDNIPSVSNRVGAAAEFEIAREAEQLSVPCLFVLPMGVSPVATVSEADGIVQKVEIEFAIVAAVDNTADPRGATAADNVPGLGAEIIAAMLNWTPDQSVFDRCWFTGAEYLGMDRDRLWHQWGFATRRLIHVIESPSLYDIKQVYLGVAPEIGPEHVDDYWLIGEEGKAVEEVPVPLEDRGAS